MLIKQPQIRIVSRPVTLATGEAVLAYFALVNIEGSVEVRFLGFKPAPQEEAVLALPAAFRQAFITPVQSYFTDYVAPLLKTRLFLLNQLARAPSFN